MNAITQWAVPETKTTMRAIGQKAYGGVEVLVPGDHPVPVAGPREVLIRVEAAGLDRGTWHMMTGRPYLMRLMGFGFSRPKAAVAGFDVAGTVTAVGEGVTRFRVGDAVFGVARGSFAEVAAAHEDKLARKPASLSFDEAAALGISGSTALQGLVGLQAGQRLLILGASGGVGSFAVQIAKARGAHVTGVCSAKKAAAVKALGADAVRDYAKDALGGPYDVILDLGGNNPLSVLRQALTPTGTIVFGGGEHGGDITAGFGRLLWSAVVGLFVKQKFVMLMSKEHFTPLEEVAALVDAGKVRPAIDRTWPLAQVPDAMRALVAGDVTGKSVIRVA